MRKTAILAGLMLIAATFAQAAVTVDVAPVSLVTSPITVAASSQPVGLFSFALTGTAGETLSSVVVTLNPMTGSTVSGSDIASLAVYKDDGNGIFGSGDVVAGSQTTVNVGTPTTITVSSNNALTTSTRFFVAMSTGSTWGTASTPDSLTATLGTTAISTSANSPTVTAVTTSTVSSQATVPSLNSAVASNTSGNKSVVLTFSSATNSPTINASNINSTLMLNNSHSWLDGNGQIGTNTWSSDGKTLTVNLTSNVSAPTLAVGDTVTLSGSVIKDITSSNNATGSTTISGSLVAPATPTLSAAVASNTGNNTGLGAGDSVALTFSSATNAPAITASNINTVLALNNSHSWLDGASQIGSATWSTDAKTLTVTLSAGTSAPTVAVGDVVTVGGSVIKDPTNTNNATGNATISGNFSGSTNNQQGDDNENERDNDEGEGRACPNTLINGLLYKTADSPTVYLAADCRLKPFRGAAVFHARGHKFQNIIVLQSLTGLTVSQQPALPATGTLVKGSDKTVWFVETGHKRKGFASAQAFLGLGFNFGQVSQISDSDLNTMPTDPNPILNATQHPDGALVRCTTSPTVGQISGSTVVPFANSDAFTLRGHTFQQVATINCAVFHYVQSAPVSQ